MSRSRSTECWIASALLATVCGTSANAASEGTSYRNAQASCTAQVLAKITQEGRAEQEITGDFSPMNELRSPSGRARVAQCEAIAGFTKQGYENALAALAADGTNRNENIFSALADIAKMRGDRVAYARYNRLEAVASRKNFKEIDSENRTLCGADSDDEQEICNNEGGAPDHVESFHSAGGSLVTWRYGSPDYRKAYTFKNGVLTSTFKP